MHRLLLSTTAAAALVLGVVAVSAQQAQQPSGAGSQQTPQQTQGGTTGGGTAGPAPGSERAGGTATQRQGDSQRGADCANNPNAPGCAQQAQGARPAGEAQRQPSGSTAQQPAARDQQQGAQTQRREGDAQRRETTTETTKPGGDTTAAVSVSGEARTKLKEVVKTKNIERVNVNFSVSVGATVPRTIVLHPVPEEIVTIVPAWRTYRILVLADGDIIIVDPDTFRIVAIIEA
jgi:hypothetical protein